MSAIVLTWNPRRWSFDENERADQKEQTESGRLTAQEWSVGRRRTVPERQRAFLLRQGDEPRGIVASGWTGPMVPVSDAVTDGDATARYVEVSWDYVVDEDEPLPTTMLIEQVPGVSWNSLRQSGTEIPESAVAALEPLWLSHVQTAAPRHERRISRWRRERAHSKLGVSPSSASAERS